MDFHVRSDSVDVEQIMGQIRGRIREKRGADYSEAELQHLANLKLEKFLDSRGVRSTLVEAFRKTRVASAEPPTYEFTDETLFESPRPWLRKLRGLLAPILRLFVNPDRVSAAFRVQKEVNADFHRRFRAREEMDPLYYEVVHNLVVELTRTSIETQNLKMRVESLSSRLDFDERRSRSLEDVVQYKPAAPARSAAPAAVESAETSAEQKSDAAPRQPDGSNRADATGPGGDRRRRRRRRRRRPGQTAGEAQGGWQSRSAGAPTAADAGNGSLEDSSSDDGGDGEDDRSTSSDVDQ
jgi:hypothetical protein